MPQQSMGVLIAISGVLYMSVNERILKLKRKARDDYWEPGESDAEEKDAESEKK